MYMHENCITKAIWTDHKTGKLPGILQLVILMITGLAYNDDE